MSVPEILKALELHTGRFPRQAVKDAIEQRDAITPELVRVLEQVAEDPGEFAERENYMLHLYSMYLLAQFREKAAYRPLVRMFSAPGEIPDQLAGDTVTESLGQIFGSVFDGDPEPLQRLVEDAGVYEYVRSAALDAFLVLVKSGQMARDEVVSYFGSLFEEKLGREPNHVWNMLACAVADLPAPELMDHVRQAYAADLIETGFATLDEIEASLHAPGRRRADSHTVITDAIAEMEWWASFQPERPRSKSLASKFGRLIPTGPAPAPRVKVGRNDPCPCGSGKKFKKCCGTN